VCACVEDVATKVHTHSHTHTHTHTHTHMSRDASCMHAYCVQWCVCVCVCVEDVPIKVNAFTHTLSHTHTTEHMSKYTAITTETDGLIDINLLLTFITNELIDFFSPNVY
jgi:hypothetical protein